MMIIVRLMLDDVILCVNYYADHHIHHAYKLLKDKYLPTKTSVYKNITHSFKTFCLLQHFFF